MEVRFTPEQLSRLSQVATRAGMNTEQLVQQAALDVLKDDARFREAVKKGVEQADRGELIEDDEMNVRIQRMIRG